MKSLYMMTDHKKINMPQTKPEITYKKMAYDYIYAEIAKGHYAAGERIVAKTIADELGISLAPVREAIMDMANSGMIEYRPHAGAVVRNVTKRELFQHLKLRIIVEPFAASEAAKYASNQDLINIEKAYENMQSIARDIAQTRDPKEQQKNFMRFNHADMCFHLEVLKDTKNKAIFRFGQLLMDSFYLNGIKNATQETKIHSYNESLESHLAILRALLKRDPELSEETMRYSLSLGQFNILEADLEKELEETNRHNIDDEIIHDILA